jgi:3D (Asp-Asp-Asp) domain-containing protein
MNWIAIVTAYALGGITFDNTRISWNQGNPRIVAASDEDIRSKKIRMGQLICLTFPQGDRITYTVRDRCVACDAGGFDLLVDSHRKAITFGRQKLKVSLKKC